MCVFFFFHPLAVEAPERLAPASRCRERRRRRPELCTRRRPMATAVGVARGDGRRPASLVPPRVRAIEVRRYAGTIVRRVASCRPIFVGFRYSRIFFFFSPKYQTVRRA